MTNDNTDLDGWDVVFSYTRAEAIADGFLMDATEMAAQLGFRVPVALTAELWHRYVTPSPDLEAQGQSADGRLVDVLMVLRSRATVASDVVHFPVFFLMEPDRPAEAVTPKAHIGPGDEGEPVITIMMPWED